MAFNNEQKLRYFTVVEFFKQKSNRKNRSMKKQGLFFFYVYNLLLVVISAVSANLMSGFELVTLRALYQSRSAYFPICRTGMFPLFAYFTFRNSHDAPPYLTVNTL